MTSRRHRDVRHCQQVDDTVVEFVRAIALVPDLNLNPHPIHVPASEIVLHWIGNVTGERIAELYDVLVDVDTGCCTADCTLIHIVRPEASVDAQLEVVITKTRRCGTALSGHSSAGPIVVFDKTQ